MFSYKPLKELEGKVPEFFWVETLGLRLVHNRVCDLNLNSETPRKITIVMASFGRSGQYHWVATLATTPAWSDG